MGLRFKRILRVLPGVRLNFSKSGLSTSLGVRGAGINLGKSGVTTSAGIPGTGISWRQKLGSKGSWIGIATLVAGLAYAGYSYLSSSQTHTAAIPQAAVQMAPAAPAASTVAAPPAPYITVKKEPLKPGTRYVRRNNSVLRTEAKPSAKALAHKAKGAAVTVLSISKDGWAEVKDGTLHGFMRASVLGEPPAPP